ncbi:response regulator transcription factor [Clostridium sp. VAP41]|uniref:response regulator transcription factor n=1 Tax=Clostridium sp. VAP41 TaxID=2949979 RepID=UPI00207AD4DE|nr:response regulator transcription factor [Clostridium sp. VAP41]
MKKILIVEDDIILNSGLCYNLQLDGYVVTPKYNINSTLKILNIENFDLIILDVNLPDGNGFDLCKSIKQIQDTPIIFLTACDLEDDILSGFKLGADDYITKPFNINIFRQKIAAILRRCTKNLFSCIYKDSNLTIDFNEMTATVNDNVISFTPTEFKMLKILISNKGQVLTRQVLLEKLWDCDRNFVDEHTLTVNINRLRNKIETENVKYIKTIYGMGYMWLGGKYNEN